MPGLIPDNNASTADEDQMLTALNNIDGSIGQAADVPSSSFASWYTSACSFIGKLGLLIAVSAGAGGHAYGYNGSGQLVTDAWTLFGTTRTKTFTYNTDGTLATETDWV